MLVFASQGRASHLWSSGRQRNGEYLVLKFGVLRKVKRRRALGAQEGEIEANYNQVVNVRRWGAGGLKACCPTWVGRGVPMPTPTFVVGQYTCSNLRLVVQSGAFLAERKVYSGGKSTLCEDTS